MIHSRVQVLAPTLLACLVSPALAGSDPVPATLEILRLDEFDGEVVGALNPPVTDGAGRGAVLMSFITGFGIWYDGAQIFNRDDALPLVLNTTSDRNIGIADDGSFVFSARCNSFDCVYTDEGVVLTEGDPAPDAPAGVNITEFARTTMTNAGVAYWIAGLNDGAGGTATITNRLYRRATDGTISTVFAQGETLGASTVGTIGPIYDVSGANDHVIVTFIDPTQPTTSDVRIAVNGVVVAGEGLPTGSGDNWDNFDGVSINSSGDYAFIGDTDGNSNTDQFVAVNGAIVLREGDITSAGTVNGNGTDAISINDLGQLAIIWEMDLGASSGNTESLLFARDPANIAGSLYRLLSLGDEIDTSGDGVADFRVQDFRAAHTVGPGLDLAEDGRVFVRVDLDSIDGTIVDDQALISLALPTPCNIADLADPFGTLDFSDVVAFLTAFGTMDTAADLAPPTGVFDFSDVVAFLTAFGAGCP